MTSEFQSFIWIRLEDDVQPFRTCRMSEFDAMSERTEVSFHSDDGEALDQKEPQIPAYFFLFPFLSFLSFLRDILWP